MEKENPLDDRLTKSTGHLNDYEKIRIVGKGSFGTAYLCRRPFDGCLVVIKEIVINNLTPKERWLAVNEIKVLSSIRHPNIVSYYDNFEADGLLMIVMEYADGGALDQYLSRLCEPMRERDILGVLEQIVQALSYIHQRKKPILHRDLKPANIFLANGLRVKLGDFGISKMLATRRGGATATTFVGTPYYTCPEIYERKPYDDKSDIWSMGCIVYEMASLRKPFEAANLMMLYKVIIQGRYPPLGANYSPLFKLLLRDALQRDPEFRPSARQILERRLPDLMSPFKKRNDERQMLKRNAFLKRQMLQERQKNSDDEIQMTNRSVIYRLKWNDSGDMQMDVLRLAPEAAYQLIAVSSTHFVTFTSELRVVVQLPLEDGQTSIDRAEMVKMISFDQQLNGESIVGLEAGERFTAFVSSTGLVMSCGEGQGGCLGHGDLISQSAPKIVEKLLMVDVSCVACGPSHVVAVSRDGRVFSWGHDDAGALGLALTKQTNQPEELQLPKSVTVVSARCGPSGTFLLTDGPTLLACGHNRYNRLGLDTETIGGLPSLVFKRARERSTASVATPTTLAQSNFGTEKIVEAAIGLDHSAVLSHTGRILILGSNERAQRGLGHCRHVGRPSSWLQLSHPIIAMSCGDHSTMVLTSDNIYHCWGSIDSPCKHPAPGIVAVEWPSPTQILALYSSEDQLKRELTVRSRLLRCRRDGSAWLLVDTTAPLAEKSFYNPNVLLHNTPDFEF